MKLKTKKTVIEPARKNNVLLLPHLVLFFMCCCGCAGLKHATSQPDAAALVPAAVDIINLALNDPDPAVRTAAIETVATTGRLDLMPKVQKLLTDPFVPVRFAANLAVAETRYSLAKNNIKSLLTDPDENVRIAAAFCLSTFTNEGRLPEMVTQALKSSDQTVRANAVILAGKSADKSSIDTLYRIINDRKSADKVRFQAAEAIAKLGDERIYPKLWTMLISVYADDRVMGIRAMAELGTPQAQNALITMLDDPVAEVRLAAAGQLGRLGEKFGESEVLNVLNEDLTEQLKARDSQRLLVLAALAIGQIKSQRLVEFLPQLLENESALVRTAAAKAVFQLQIPR